jgi:hypothetical protein
MTPSQQICHVLLRVDRFAVTFLFLEEEVEEEEEEEEEEDKGICGASREPP